MEGASSSLIQMLKRAVDVDPALECSYSIHPFLRTVYKVIGVVECILSYYLEFVVQDRASGTFNVPNNVCSLMCKGRRELHRLTVRHFH